MARHGVTITEVARAASALRSSGLEPTVDRVRERLGTGSRSTIGPLLKQWRKEKRATEEEDLPTDLLDAMKALSARVRDAADQQVAQCRAEYEARATELNEQLVRTTAEMTRLESEKEASTGRLNEQAEELNALRRELEHVRISSAKVEVSRDEAVAEITDLKSQLNEQKLEIQAMRKQSEHYQQMVAEDRQRERGEHQALIQQYQEQIQKLLDQTSLVESRYTDLKTNHDSLRHELDTRMEESRITNDRYTRLKIDTESLMLRMKELIQEREKMQAQVEASRSQATQSGRALAASEESIRHLTRSLEKTEHRLAASERYTEQLIEENKHLILEKAMTEGKLKQLRQASGSAGSREDSAPASR